MYFFVTIYMMGLMYGVGIALLCVCVGGSGQLGMRMCSRSNLQGFFLSFFFFKWKSIEEIVLCSLFYGNIDL